MNMMLKLELGTYLFLEFDTDTYGVIQMVAVFTWCLGCRYS